MNRLSQYYDIAGRVTRESEFDSQLTVGGIIFPTSEEDKVRAAVGDDTPKWKNSNPESLSLIANIVNRCALYCIVLKIKKSEPAWTDFWNGGERQYQYMSSRTKPKPGFAKSGNVLKYFAFGRCSAIGLGLYLKSRGKPIVLDANGFSVLCLRIVCDTDIQGQENQELFEENWKHWCSATKLTSHFGIKPYLDAVEFKTEQEENVLILPDYLAGYIHYSSDPDRIALPANLSPQDANQFGEILSTYEGFNLIEYSFDEIFPNLTR